MRTTRQKPEKAVVRNVRTAIACGLFASAIVLVVLAAYIPGWQSLAGTSSLNSPAAPTQIDCGGFNSTIHCTDVSPRTDNFFPTNQDLQHSVSGRLLSVTVSADGQGLADGQRLYAGTFSGVWRSDHENATWRQRTRPQPPSGTNFVPGALMVPTVFDVAVSPENKDVVLAATAYDTRIPLESKNGIYRSNDGGNSWDLVYQFKCSGGGYVSQVVFAHDNPNLLFATGGCAIAKSEKGGEKGSWEEKTIQGAAWHVAVAPPEGSIRRVYAAGDGRIFYSTNGGNTWFKDNAAIIPDMGKFQGTAFGVVGSIPVGGGGNSSQILAIEPGHPDNVFLAVSNISNGPAYYFPGVPNGQNCEVSTAKCGGAALWLGDYSVFFQQGNAGNWRRLASPPTYFGVSTASGRVYVLTKKTSSGYLLFLADQSHVHVSQGRPEQSASWHRLDGRDASQSKRDDELFNKLFVHVDPNAIAVSSDFEITLKPSNLPSPFNKNSELDRFLGGTIWMGNDGGVYRSTDGGVTWSLTGGLATLQPPSSFAGVALPGKAPALYFGVPDNDNFFSLNGGVIDWKDPVSGCGDCSSWFSDPAQPDRVLEQAGRDNPPGFALYFKRPAEVYPNASDGMSRKAIPTPGRCGIPRADGSCVDSPTPLSPPPCSENQCYISEFIAESPVESGVSISKLGYRPIILTPLNEAPLADGDHILIRVKPNGTRVLLRTTKLSSITSTTDWDTTAFMDGPNTKVFQQGPDFLLEMNNVDVVQAAGGHANPVFYVGDPASTNKGLWRWPTSGKSTWTRIVGPGLSAREARRFFVDPYDSNLIYIIDIDGIKRSTNGGQTWEMDESLDRAVTENKSFSYDISGVPRWVGYTAVINDMIFDRKERGTRFTVGNAGVFLTVNGENWERLLSTTALPGYPVAGYFDRISDPSNPVLYVALNGRGILGLGPINTADLSITKTDSPNVVRTGKDVAYIVTVTNNGPATATSVIVTDNLPASTTFVSCSPTGGGVCNGSGNNHTVTFASLASGESETITFVATVNCSVADGTVVSNTARVSSSTPDPNTNNNSATATTTASNPPPTITGASVDKPVLWPPNHKLVNVTVSYEVTDNCPLPPNSCTLSVSSNEPINGTGDGNTSPDWIILDAHHVQLRAERAGNGNGRIYTIGITCVDSGRSSSHKHVEVTVPHDRGRR
jgi:uncharacterized repeat protein (TIGR01451 family)